MDNSNNSYGSSSPSTLDDDDQQHWISNIQNAIGFKVPGILKNAPDHIRNNKKIVMIAVQKNGLALQYASPSLQNDKEVVLAAVKQNGYALQYASPSLQNDKEVVLAAVKQDGTALQYVSPELNYEDMKEVALIAVKQNPDYIKFVPSDDLKRDRDIMIAAGMFDSVHHEAAVRTNFSKKIVLSTRFSLGEETYSQATNFTALFKQSKYIQDKQLVVYAPNAFDKKTCDPEWTNFDHPCRGTKDTCQYNNIFTGDGRPTDDCCWRYSFRTQLQEAKDTGGFMIQLVETDPSITYNKVMDAVLGNGQRIELDMATEMGVKVFQVYCPESRHGEEISFEDRHIHYITSIISTWYNDNQNQCQDMSVKVIKQRYFD